MAIFSGWRRGGGADRTVAALALEPNRTKSVRNTPYMFGVSIASSALVLLSLSLLRSPRAFMKGICYA